MAHAIEPLNAPLVSADPNKLVVEEGFPLSLYKSPARFVQYFPEEQLIQRTNDFRPAVRQIKRQLKENVNKIFRDIPELADIAKQDVQDLVHDDIQTTRIFEQLDPLKGNGLATTEYLDASELCIFGAGPSMSNLVLLVSEKKLFSTESCSVQLPMDSIDIKQTIDLKYPLRQVSISPFSTSRHIIFAVRTTSTIHLFAYDHNDNLRLLHYLNLAEKTAIDPQIDYSMPIHVETSPYDKYQYVYTTNNGYTSVIDAYHDKVIVAGIDPTPDTANYVSRWRSCAFGKTPFTILLASPECIKVWNYSNDMIQAKTLAISNDRIVAFKTSLKAQIYCFATIESVVLMDSYRPESPILTWMHGFRDGLVSTLILEELSDQNWRIIAFSNELQRAAMLELHYARNTSKSSSSAVKVLGLYQMPLSKYRFEHLHNSHDTIRSMGISFKARDTNANDATRGDIMFSFTRLFEDGSVKIQHMALLNCNPKEAGAGRFVEKPRLEFRSVDPRFDELLRNAKLAMLPSFKDWKHRNAEVRNIKTKNFESYLQDDVQCGLAALTDNVKSEIASRVRQLQNPTTVRALFDYQAYQNYRLQDLLYFLERLEENEDIELTGQLPIPSLMQHFKPADQELNRKIQEAYEKEAHLSKIIICPMPYSKDPHKFQYLGRQNLKFTSTTTSKVLSNCWSIDDSRFNALPFPKYDTSSLPQPEAFPSVNMYKRRRSSTIPFPDLKLEETQPQDEEEEEEIMPVVVKATPTTKVKESKATAASQDTKRAVKKRVTAASTQPCASVPMLSPLRPTTQSPSLGLTPPQSHPAMSFSDISTQPVEGAFSIRKKIVQKKKKAKSSGFK